MIYSEFGACFDGEECKVEIDNSADAFDEALASWNYWMYKSFGDFTTTGGTKEGMYNKDGTPQARKLRAITRTYMHAWQGNPIRMFFNTKDGSFFASFAYDSKINQPSELYLHKALWYPNYYKVVITTEDGVVKGAELITAKGSNYGTISIKPGTVKDG